MAAAQWHVRAGAFVGKSDFAESARHAQRARELLRGVADDPSAPALGADVCFRALSLGLRLGLAEHEVQEIFQEGLAWAARTSDPLLAGRLHQARAVLEIGSNRIDGALTYAAEWARVARAMPDEERRACALWPSFQPLLTRGDLAAVRTACLQQVAWTRDNPEWGMRDWGISAYADTFRILGSVELFDGTFDRARELLERGIDVARRVGDKLEDASCCDVLGDLGFLAGEPDLARAAVEHSVRTSEPLGPFSRQWAHGRLGRQLILDGRAAEAVEALEHAMSFCSEGNRNLAPWMRQALAQASRRAPVPSRTTL